MLDVKQLVVIILLEVLFSKLPSTSSSQPGCRPTDGCSFGALRRHVVEQELLLNACTIASSYLRRGSHVSEGLASDLSHTEVFLLKTNYRSANWYHFDLCQQVDMSWLADFVEATQSIICTLNRGCGFSYMTLRGQRAPAYVPTTVCRVLNGPRNEDR